MTSSSLARAGLDIVLWAVGQIGLNRRARVHAKKKNVRLLFFFEGRAGVHTPEFFLTTNGPEGLAAYIPLVGYKIHTTIKKIENYSIILAFFRKNS